MIFPPNNLPTASKNWAREVEKKVTNLESSFRSAEVNNVTRDSQLSVTANAALNAATQAQTAATAANNAAIQAQNAANTANSAITALGQLDEETSTYKINAANLTVGTLSGNRIRGGVITGTQLTTADAGSQRVLLESNQIKFNNGNSDTGSIFGSTYGGANATYIQGNACVISSSQGNYFVGNTGVYGGSFSAENGISTSAQISATGNITSSGNITGNGANSTVSAPFITASNTLSGVSITSGSISNSGNYTGNGFPTIRDNTVTGTSFPVNVFISGSTGNMARRSDLSERRAKENIEEVDFDADAFISINPVTFNYKREAVSDDEQAARRNIGFILDDFEDAGFGEFLVYQEDGDDNKQLRYDLMSIYLHKVVQKQAATITDLTARLEALESR